MDGHPRCLPKSPAPKPGPVLRLGITYGRGVVLPRKARKRGASVPHPLDFWKHSRDILFS